MEKYAVIAMKTVKKNETALAAWHMQTHRTSAVIQKLGSENKLTARLAKQSSEFIN